MKTTSCCLPSSSLSPAGPGRVTGTNSAVGPMPGCYADTVHNGDPNEAEAVPFRSLEMVAQMRVGTLDPFGRAEQIAEQLTAAIGIGILNKGERLPPELALAEQLGVSPLTLRQSLALLRSKGLLETRRGRGGGSFISGNVSVSEAHIRARLTQRGTDDLRDLGDVAASVAASAARLAALRSDRQDIRRIRDLAVRFDEAPGVDELRRADARLHIGLGVASQSRRLTTLMIQIQSEMAPLSWGQSWTDYRAQASADHGLLIDAIERRDAAAAERLAREHFELEAALLIDQHLDLLTSGTESP